MAGKSSAPSLHHLVEAVHAGGGLLGDALDLVRDLGPAVGALGEDSLEDLEDDLLLVAGGRGGVGRDAGLLGSTPRWTSRVASPPSSRIMLAKLCRRASCRICWVHHQYSSSVSPFQAKTGTPAGCRRCLGADRDRGGRVVLGGEDVAAGPADLGAELDQGLDQHRGLDGHVQRAGDAGAGQRLGVAVALPHGHQAGHLVLGEGDLGAAEVGQGEVGDLEVHEASSRSAVRPGSPFRLDTRASAARRILATGLRGRRRHVLAALSDRPARGARDARRGRGRRGRCRARGR